MIVTTATNKKVRELLKSVRDGNLVPRPEFQRRLVWTAKDKDRFIESVLKGFPFPEIYMCNGEVDIESGEGTQLLVDGLQRVNTLTEYFNGQGSFSHVVTVPYKELTKEEKEKFLEYSVVVRDLGQITKDQIVEVFRRLNSTQYTLREMEVNNAIYDGALKKFCERVSEDVFFEYHRVFTATDRRRMGDVSFCLSIVGTMMLGYFNRDDEHENLLSRFNEAFPDEREYEERITRVFNVIEELGFREKSRIWKKADFFTALIEIDSAMEHLHKIADLSELQVRLEDFYDKVDQRDEGASEISRIYYKSALQASNDRSNRLRRGLIVGGLISGRDNDFILGELANYGLS